MDKISAQFLGQLYTLSPLQPKIGAPLPLYLTTEHKQCIEPLARSPLQVLVDAAYA